MSLQKPDDRLLDLAKKWLDGTITSEERSEFDKWYNSFDDSFYESNFPGNPDNLKERLKTQIFSQADIPQSYNHKSRSYFWIGVAASLLLILSTGIYFLNTQAIQKKRYTNVHKHELPPGSNKATLKLASGRSIVLDDAVSGEIASEGSVAISKSSNGRVAFDKKTSNSSTPVQAVAYNILTVPKGGQYQLTLADGTQVWLNAASSIKFPTDFNRVSREVEITGEAYFEVAHNANKPFRVFCNGQKVEVLGTHFDVNAYTDEPAIKTTLFEGKVKLSKASQSAILTPGQQAQMRSVDGATSIAVSKPQNIDEVIAWKNGFFEFNQADVQTVMRQVARWYDVEVLYTGKIPDKTFSGNISRNSNASQLLEILSYTGLHFKIDGKKIIVTP